MDTGNCSYVPDVKKKNSKTSDMLLSNIRKKHVIYSNHFTDIFLFDHELVLINNSIKLS